MFDTVELSQYAYIEMGQSPDSNYVSDNLDVGIPFLQGNAEFSAVYPVPKYSCTQPMKVCQKGDLLISVRAPVGEINIADQDYCIGRGLAAIRFEEIPPIIGKSLLEHAKNQLRKVAQGSTFEAINKNNLAELKIVNIPKAELLLLEKIAGNLEVQIRETESIIAKLQQVKQGLLHDLLTRGVDENGELRPSYEDAPELYKSSELGWIPKDWERNTLANLLSEPTRNGLYKPKNFHGFGPLMVQMGGLFSGKEVTFDSATRVNVSQLELQTYGLTEGDLLFARRSLVFEGAGLCTIVSELPEPATFESSIIRARINDKIAIPTFVCDFLRCEISYSQRRKLIRQVAVSGVTSGDLKELIIPLPPLTEQMQIQQIQTSSADRISAEKIRLEKLKLKKSGLMDDLLTGKKRVTDLLKQQAN